VSANGRNGETGDTANGRIHAPGGLANATKWHNKIAQGFCVRRIRNAPYKGRPRPRTWQMAWWFVTPARQHGPGSPLFLLRPTFPELRRTGRAISCGTLPRAILSCHFMADALHGFDTPTRPFAAHRSAARAKSPPLVQDQIRGDGEILF
jgi:hypothetical protein